MKDQKNVQIVRGIVVEALPNIQFRVQINPQQQGYADKAPQRTGSAIPSASSAPETLDTESQEDKPENKPEPDIVLAYLGGKMRIHKIRVMVGDSVEMQLDPYGGRPRIVRRL